MISWKTRDIADMYYRLEGFLVGWDICPCGARVRAAIPPECPRKKLECFACGKRTAKFIESK